MSLKQQQEAADYRTVQTHNVQRHISRAVREVGQIDTEAKYSVPTYVLKDMEKQDVNIDLGKSSAVKRSSMLTKSNRSTKGERSPAPIQSQRSQTSVSRRPSQQQCVSQGNKTNLHSSTWNGVRNKSRHEVTTKRSQTSSATVSTSRTAVARTNQQLQRKIHGGNVAEADSQTKKIQTYAIKKPLPYKASSATVKCQSPSARHRSAVKHLPEYSSTESLLSDSPSRLSCDYVETHNDVVHPKLRQHKVLPGTATKPGSKAKSATLPRTPTPKPSVRQLNDIRAGFGLRVDNSPRANDDILLQSQQPYVQPYSKSKKDEMQMDRGTAQVRPDGAVRSHSSHSAHRFRSKYDSHYYRNAQTQQPIFDYPASTAADCQTRHVQIAREPAESNGGRHQHQQQAPETTPSTSQESVITDVRPVTRPVPVAPSGPAGHRRVSKIPRPKLALDRPSMSATSIISKCSSVTSLRSEFNYARPMPIERIPFSKFGLEYIVPLARQEVFVTATEAFSITGMSGKRKRFLPLIESIAEDLWEKVQNRVNPLSAVTAQHDAGQDACNVNVSIISSTVARAVSHAATQTRKSVSLKQRKKTRLLRKEKAEKQNESSDDYSGMLVRLVQLLYLQAKLNASKVDKTKTANTHNSNQTLIDYQQKHQQQQHAAPRNATFAEPTQMSLHTPPQSSDHGARVYRAGSSVSQVYSKNYSSAPVGSAKNESTNNWTNEINSRTVYFDQAKTDDTPWRSHQSPTTAAFTPSYSQRYHNYDNRLSKISAYSGSSNMRYIN